MSNRVELSGTLQDQPEIRVTPAGGRFVRLALECGEPAKPLVLPIVASGDLMAQAAAAWRKGQRIRVTGTLRAAGPIGNRNGRARSRLGIEVIASNLDSDGPAQPVPAPDHTEV